MPTTILATRFNNLQDRLDAVLGTSGSVAPTFGYGQTLNAALDVAGTRANTLPNSDKITAQQYEDLYIDIVRCRAHQVGAASVTIDDFVIGDFETNAASTDKVAEAYISALESLMTIVETNRFTIDATTQATTTNLTTSTNIAIASTYYTAVSGTWNNFLNQIFSITFPTTEARRHFFNAGGEIRFNGSVAYTGSQQKTSDWQSSLAGMGAVSFGANSTFSNSSVGSSSNVGNNNLTSTYQLCYRKDAGATYSQSAYEIYALTTGARTVQFKVLFTDPAPGGWHIDEPLYGDWTSSVSLLVPNGSVSINGTAHDTVVIVDDQLPVGNTIVGLSAVTPPVPTYSLSRSASSASEGNSASFTLATGNVSNGTVIAYTITGVTASDINIPLQGSFVVGASTTVTITFANDLLTEGTETLTLALNNGASTISIAVSDTSITPPPSGTLLSQYCSGFDLYGTYTDGSGGTYNALIQANSPTCGYVPPFTFSISPSSYSTQNTAWDIGDTVINTTATTNIIITVPAGVRSGIVTVQETSKPSVWGVAVDDVSIAGGAAGGVVTKNYSLVAGQSITVPISVTPTSVLNFRDVNRQFHFTALEASGSGQSYKIYWTGAGVPVPQTPNINTTLNVDKVIGNETTSNTFTFSGTVTGWQASTGPVSWQQDGYIDTDANDFLNGVTGTAPVTITNSPNTGDGTYSFTRSIRSDSTTEGSEDFGTYAYLASVPTVRSSTRIVSISDTSIDTPVEGYLNPDTHTFNITPTQSYAFSTVVSLTSAPNNNPVTLSLAPNDMSVDWLVSVGGMAADMPYTFTLSSGQSKSITTVVTATDGPESAFPGTLYLYQGSGAYNGQTILDIFTFTGTTTSWAAPTIVSAGWSPRNPIVGTPATLYYNTTNATQVDYLITGNALVAGLAATYDNGLTLNGVSVGANTDYVTFTDEGTANWSVIASTPDGQTATASGQITTTLIEPNYQLSILGGTSYTEGDTITFQLRYKNVTSGASYRFFRSDGVDAAADYTHGGIRFNFFGLNTAQDNVWRTTTRTLTSVNDGIYEGTKSYYMSDADAITHYADWTLADQPIANTFVITPSSVPVGSLWTFNATGAPNTLVTYTAASVPDYNQVGSTFRLSNSGSYTRSALHTLPGDFTYVGTFPVGSPQTNTATVRICPVLSITMASSALPGNSVSVTISGGLRNGTFFWGHNQAAGGITLSFNGSGVASFSFTAGSPATYSYTATENFCNGTASASITVSQVYSPSTVMSPTSPRVGQTATLSISGGRPNGTFNITGPHPVAASFDPSGNYTISSEYSVADTFEYVLVVPAPDNSASFSVVIQPALPSLYYPTVILAQPGGYGQQIVGSIAGAKPNDTLAWAATHADGGEGSASIVSATGTIGSSGSSTFSYNGNTNYNAGTASYAVVNFLSDSNYPSGYDPINTTITSPTTPPPPPIPFISFSPTTGTINDTFVTLSWNGHYAGGAPTFVEVAVEGPAPAERIILAGSSGSITEQLAIAGTWIATIVARNAGGENGATATHTAQTPSSIPVPTIAFSAATYNTGATITATVNPDYVGGTYSSISKITSPNGNTMDSSTSTSAHTLTTTADVVGTYTASILVLYRGQDGYTQLSTTATASTTVTGPPISGIIRFSESSYSAGETVVATWSTAGPSGTSFRAAITAPNGNTVQGTGASGTLVADSAYYGTGTYLAGLTANGSQIASDSVNVAAVPIPLPVINTFSWSPSQIYNGGYNTLSWNVTAPFGTTLSITGPMGTIRNNSSEMVGTYDNGPYNTNGSYTQTIVATSGGGSATSTATVSVIAYPTPAAPTISFSPAVGYINDTTYTLTWNANGASSATITTTLPDGVQATNTELVNSISTSLSVLGLYESTIVTAGGTASASTTALEQPDIWENPPEDYPPAGTVLTSTCGGTLGDVLIQQIANGSGGSTTTYTANSPTCGYTPPVPAAGTLLSQFCSGFNLYGTYTDGSGGTYNALIEANNVATCNYVAPASYALTISVTVGTYNGATSPCTAYFTGTPGAIYGWAATGGANGSGTFDSSGNASVGPVGLTPGSYYAALVSSGESVSTTFRVLAYGEDYR